MRFRYGHPAQHVCLPTSCLKSTHDSCIYLRILAPNTISIPVDALSVNNNTTGVTTVAEPSRTPEITTQFLLGLVLLDIYVFCRSLFDPLSHLLYNWCEIISLNAFQPSSMFDCICIFNKACLTKKLSTIISCHLSEVRK